MTIATRNGLSMGGAWSLRQPVAAPDGAHLVQAACDTVEAQMSAWRPNSALARLNRAPFGAWVDIPAEMEIVLRAGLQLMAREPGAFSVLLGGLSARLGFQPGPARDGGTDPAMVELQPGRARRLAEVSVDLNAIAKGFAADLAARLLREAGATNFLIEVAGDILAMGERPDGLPWTAAVELPLTDRIVPARFLPLLNCGLASSGGYRRNIGDRSHLMDPASGRALPAAPAVVAVLAPTAMEADGWATVLSVLGPDKGMATAVRRGLPALWIVPAADGSGFVEIGSPAMADRLGQFA